MLAILEKHADVRALFENGWLHLFALEGGKVAGRYVPGLGFADVTPPALAALSEMRP